MALYAALNSKFGTDELVAKLVSTKVKSTGKPAIKISELNNLKFCQKAQSTVEVAETDEARPARVAL